MKSYLKWVSVQAESDEADSTVISTVFVIPILLMMIITMIEVPILFSNRNLLQNDLRQGARTVAILGGASDGEGGSALASTYGASDACRVASSWINSRETVGEDGTSYPVVKTKNIATCATAQGIGDNSGYIAFHVYNIECGPNKAKKIGEATYCQASYYYDGIPGGSMSLIGGAQHFGWGRGVYDDAGGTGETHLTGSTGRSAENRGGMNSGIMRMSAQSEVCLDADCTR